MFCGEFCGVGWKVRRGTLNVTDLMQGATLLVGGVGILASRLLHDRRLRVRY
jgi:hypothetical protein